MKIRGAVRDRFQKDLLVWYERHRRALPWRNTRDPYRILVSEMLLQQTRAAVAEAYYRRFLRSFPNLETLARAPLESVLRVWQGLGYYSRARNFHRTARHLVASREGKIPSSVEELVALPGIGPYTAAAVASIAFGRDEAVVDGNVVRVLCRVFAREEDPATPGMRKTLQEVASRLLPKGKAALFNQALMELGALTCRPRQPLCPSCPLSPVCEARKSGNPDRLPVRRRKPPLPCRNRVVAVVECGGRLLFFRRPPEGFLGGLWELPGLYLTPGEMLDDASKRLERALEDFVGLSPVPGGPSQPLRHTYTHFHENLHPTLYLGDPRRGETILPGRKQNRRWFNQSYLDRVAITGATRKILRHLEESKRAKDPNPGTGTQRVQSQIGASSQIRTRSVDVADKVHNFRKGSSRPMARTASVPRRLRNQVGGTSESAALRPAGGKRNRARSVDLNPGKPA